MKFCKLFFAVLVLFGTEHLFSDEALISTVKEEAPAAWAKYLESLKEVDVSYYYETRENNEESEISPVYDFYNRYPSSLDKYERNGKLFVSGLNKRYTFLVSSADGNVWELVNAEDQSQKHVPLDFPQIGVPRSDLCVANWNTSQLAAALKLNVRVWFPSYFREAEFTVLEAEEVTEEGKRLVRVKFQYEPEVFDNEYPLRSGEVFLLPDCSWVIKKADFILLDVDGETPVHCHVDIDYGDSADIFPRPLSFTLKIDEGQFYKKKFYTWKDLSKISSKEFTLSYYGIKEPDFGGGRLSRLSCILIAIGIVLFFVSLFKAYKKRKLATGNDYERDQKL